MATWLIGTLSQQTFGVRFVDSAAGRCARRGVTGHALHKTNTNPLLPLYLPHPLLLLRYRVPEPNLQDKNKVRLFNRKIAGPIRLRVVNVLKQWIDKHYSDFKV